MEILTVIFEQMEATAEWKSVCKLIDAEITKVIYDENKICSKSDCEARRDKVFAVIRDAEKQAFMQGFSYAWKLWKECQAD